MKFFVFPFQFIPLLDAVEKKMRLQTNKNSIQAVLYKTKQIIEENIIENT